MSELSEKTDQQIEAWRVHALAATSEALQMLYQCYLTRNYCSQLENKLLEQRLKMERQRKRLNLDIDKSLDSTR
jgi:hypothetical protein